MSYSSGTINTVLNDLATFTVQISVGDSFTLCDVDVEVDMTHEYTGDLDIEVRHPDSTSVKLMHVDCGNDADFHARFDDSSSTTIDGAVASDSVCASNSGSTYVRPQGTLSSFNGKNSQGTWTLYCRNRSCLTKGSHPISIVQLDLSGVILALLVKTAASAVSSRAAAFVDQICLNEPGPPLL
ncbi:proprotein convertase, P [Seminavis robusta]|uniref:Proprotein convertase, P n=1 Tax=Seminavis robusta TaxID=568900 RepID=A0A9N8DHT6_9STRA|nr:proprotein convertase, P [Seminavis robusta]|eukprot:Sro165_g073950.1 proprotein convertase, P (183) ;mRNA; f:68434-69247